MRAFDRFLYARAEFLRSNPGRDARAMVASKFAADLLCDQRYYNDFSGQSESVSGTPSLLAQRNELPVGVAVMIYGGERPDFAMGDDAVTDRWRRENGFNLWLHADREGQLYRFVYEEL